MRRLRFACVCSFSLALSTAIHPAWAAAEPVQASLSADAATVGLWRFQEGQGNTSAAAVKAPAAILHGAAWVPGREGFAVATGSGYVSIPDAPALRPNNALTVEAWVKLARSAGDLVCKNQGYMLRLGGSLSASLGIDGKWQIIKGHKAIPTGRWTHLAVTYDSATKTAAIYIDGALDAKQQLKDLKPGLMNQATAELRLGANDWSPTGSAVDGKIDSLRMSNVARTFEPLAAAHEAARRRAIWFPTAISSWVCWDGGSMARAMPTWFGVPRRRMRPAASAACITCRTTSTSWACCRGRCRPAPGHATRLAPA